MSIPAPRRFSEVVMALGVVGGIMSFVWGVSWTVWQWTDQATKHREAQALEAARIAETRRIDATRPFLDRQLRLYTEVTQVVAVLATTSDETEHRKALKRFLELYWGELALVENEEVELAMVRIKEALDRGGPRQDVQGLSLNLAHACRLSLDRAWGIHAWSPREPPVGEADKATRPSDSRSPR